ncbi:hypothetical protein C7446_1459 [Kushneria sinocarnis]|uniref:Uncharacterized protein n=1 Tax=Kushneria sinocarnis TaxID=595502 RepID=A0A420WX05_9GAMM|nr:hypothetical protein C7446_1459 [Kushneria sinocarnis]
MRHLPKAVFTSRLFERKCFRARRALSLLNTAYIRYNLPDFEPHPDEPCAARPSTPPHALELKKPHGVRLS